MLDGTHLVHSQLSVTTDGPDRPTAYGVTSPTKATTSVWRSRALHYTGLKEIVEIDEWIQVGDHVAGGMGDHAIAACVSHLAFCDPSCVQHVTPGNSPAAHLL
jgi:hypothetical protein